MRNNRAVIWIEREQVVEYKCAGASEKDENKIMTVYHRRPSSSFLPSLFAVEPVALGCVLELALFHYLSVLRVKTAHLERATNE
jgi:hypothetical protein